MIKKILGKLDKDKFKIVLAILVLLQPVISLDYLVYDFLNQFNLPRIATIIHFIIIPLFILIGFLVFDHNKKRAFVLSTIYGVIVLAYFFAHTQNALLIRNDLYLPPNFQFSTYKELVYVLTLIIPFYLIYLFFIADFSEKLIKTVISWLSITISFPIVLGNLFLFGMSTYDGYTSANIFTWFFGIYDDFDPRKLASKFFFQNGNTIGIVLFIILPLLYYFLSRSETKKDKIIHLTIIFVQSIAMVMLSTRIATYGALLTPIAIVVIMIFFKFIIRNETFNKVTVIFTCLMAVLIGTLIPFSPAYINMQVDRSNNAIVGEDNYILDGGRDEVNEQLNQPKAKYDPAYVYAFEQYGIKSNLISSVPKIYYLDWYKYTYDAKFWLDLMFNYPLEERVNGRQIQTIFIKYKWSETPTPSVDHALGLGYSTIMTGSLILESDFVQQFYSFGYAGWVILMSPWLILVAYGVFIFLMNLKKNLNFNTVIYAMSALFGLVGAYASGHTLDEFVSNIIIAFVIAILLKKLNNNEVESN
ncbi:MAG TPA: O-antigen ligase family protein [Erysipelotrichaceae bacterium]|nr:O-antigen ligase family protein [Erysipelotrichaceae bacterium]